ncbi:cytochrome C oxidase subunit IV family protein [Bacillus sp. H-16]|uniref:cytochrome C oxidase subunit IV family protein n=1 Tax=Alteribacter salitolerans TaxID=2912333 RepID=UPI0019628C3B|nr:cytochrome C oxidase subunit IV family protein [Alteribacter salitolerans]MBM7095902.1 cytochrome C oxidase subunit IV family protein [Alteribacter salitolerans]
MDPHVTDPSAPLKGKPSKKAERQLAREGKQQIISFVFMIFLTSIAFLTVASDTIPNRFAIPFILIIAGVQVIMQLYYFMHLNERGNGWSNIMLWTGFLVAGITVATLMLLIGVTKY